MRLFYCGTADADRIFRPKSFDKPNIRLNRETNPPRPRAASQETREPDEFLAGAPVPPKSRPLISQNPTSEQSYPRLTV